MVSELERFFLETKAQSRGRSEVYMKRLSVLTCFASVVLLLSGCAAFEKQPAEIGNEGPPHQLIFYNKEELSAFLDAPNLSDTELEQFLDDNAYSMNGVDSRESLDTVLQAITGKPFPIVKDATLTSITVYVETNRLHARYKTDAGGAYIFRYGLHEELQEQRDAYSYGDAKIEDIFSVDSDTPFTAAQVRNDEKNVAGVYFIETPETVVLLRLFNVETNSIERNLRAIYFDDINSVLE